MGNIYYKKMEMKFGLIKSKIEKVLAESYVKNTLKENLFVFDELVLKNKNIKKLFFIYDELSSNKKLNESTAKEFVNGMITLYENTVNKISKNQINDLKLWVDNIQCENEYKDIDNLFSNKIEDLENKILSKTNIIESLKQSPVIFEKIENTGLKDIVKVANKTVKEHLEKLDDKTKKELNEILFESEEKLKVKFEVLKETIQEKLEVLKEKENDNEVLGKINETLNKISNEKYSEINYIKLKDLSRNL